MPQCPFTHLPCSSPLLPSQTALRSVDCFYSTNWSGGPLNSPRNIVSPNKSTCAIDAPSTLLVRRAQEPRDFLLYGAPSLKEPSLKHLPSHNFEFSLKALPRVCGVGHETGKPLLASSKEGSLSERRTETAHAGQSWVCAVSSSDTELPVCRGCGNNVGAGLRWEAIFAGSVLPSSPAGLLPCDWQWNRIRKRQGRINKGQTCLWIQMM